jgi:hypothetical protein
VHQGTAPCLVGWHADDDDGDDAGDGDEGRHAVMGARMRASNRNRAQNRVAGDWDDSAEPVATVERSSRCVLCSVCCVLCGCVWLAHRRRRRVWDPWLACRA